MKQKPRWVVLAAVAAATALLAQVDVEVHEIIRFVGDSLKVKTAEIEESVTTAALTTDALTVAKDAAVTGSVTAAGFTTSGAVQAGSVTAGSLSAGGLAIAGGNVGAAGGPAANVFAKNVSAGAITASSLAVEKISLMAGGQEVGEWTPAGLVLHGGGATIEVKPDAGPRLTMTSADGNTTFVASLADNNPTISMASANGQTSWVTKRDEGPALVLGDQIYPPPPEQIILPTEGIELAEQHIRYWATAEVKEKSQRSWKIFWTVQLQDTMEFYRARSVGVRVIFLDGDGNILGDDTRHDVSLARNHDIVTISGTIEGTPKVAADVRKVDCTITVK